MWAISAEKGTTVWKHEQRVGVMSLAATGGGLVFGGDVAGNFRAFDDTTGEVLWETNIGAPVSGYPVSFAVDGKQYVAVTTGPSLVAAASRRVTPELTGETRRGASRRVRAAVSLARRAHMRASSFGWLTVLAARPRRPLRKRRTRTSSATSRPRARRPASTRAMVDRLCPAPGAARPVQGNRGGAAARRRRASRGTPSPRRCSTTSTSSA